MRRASAPFLLALAVAAGVWAQSPQPSDIAALPNKDGSLKFGVIGDFGTGDQAEYALAAQVATTWETFKFPLVILLGDNLYGSERPQDFQLKFEKPYKPLLDNHVVFQASLGNHDDVMEQKQYPPFNMKGQRYYSFKAPAQSVRFFALESTYMTPEQIVWFEKELKGSNEDWKIVYFHHPLYSSARRHGSDVQIRDKLEPLLVQYNVSVVFNGHDHVYERVKPQKDIAYFVVGSGGQFAQGDLDPKSPITAKGYDKERAFLVAEIIGDDMTFNAISASGKMVDSGVIKRRQAAK